VAAPVTQPKGGQSVLHAKGLYGNPYDGHTLAGMITDIQNNTEYRGQANPCRQGCCGHNESNKYRVWIAGHVRRIILTI
jgi:IS5 family transposase